MAYILANDGIDSEAKKTLEDLGHVVDINHYESIDLDHKIKDIDILIVRSNTKVRAHLIDLAHETKKLKMIIRAGVGLDNIDVAYAKSKHIHVFNTPNSSTNAVAELTIGHMFALARYIYHANVSMREGKWLKKSYTGIELAGKHLGLIGFGRIGQAVAKKAKALGMTVTYFSLNGPKQWLPTCKYQTKEELLKSCDFISLHIPYEKGQTPCLGKHEFSIMKKNTYIINTSRGGVVDEEALLDALEEGIVNMAALDVYQDEPTKDERIFKHERISLTPHLGASTKEAQRRIGLEIIDIIKKHV